MEALELPELLLALSHSPATDLRAAALDCLDQFWPEAAFERASDDEEEG